MAYIITQDPPNAVSEYRRKLAAEYLDKIGYDPFEDDPTISEDEVAEILREYDEIAQDNCGDDGRDFTAPYEP